MAHKYTVTYFNAKGLAETIRYMLAYGGEDFEDIRVNYDDWPNLKKSLPFKRLPYIEEDGKVCNQSAAICRYLARKFDLVGSSEWEALLADAAVDTMTDLRIEIAKFHFEEVPESKAKVKEILEKEKIPFYLEQLDNMVKENGGYFVGGKLTWADLYYAALSNVLSMMWEKRPLTQLYPHLKSLVEKVENIPQIKDWIDKRPATEW